MASQDINLLVEMGFTQVKAERALQVTGNKGVEPAMEWLLAHVDDTILPKEDVVAPARTTDATLVLTAPPTAAAQDGIGDPLEKESDSDVDATATGSAEELAKSLKCDDCGRLFKTQPEVEFHAAKSGHTSFSESTEEKKPLTEEEKREQLRKLEEKMKQKRLEREESEKVEAFEREKQRIKSGKEMIAAKKKFEDAEMKKLLDQRKREKLEEKMARDRVKDQIEQDKAARRAKFSGGKAAECSELASPSAPVSAPLPSSQTKLDYTHTKLQIRLTNGQALTQTFGCKEQLSAVRLYVQMNRTDGAGNFTLMTTFPKKVFDEEDYEKPLDALGLIPSAVIMVSKAPETFAN